MLPPKALETCHHVRAAQAGTKTIKATCRETARLDVQELRTVGYKSNKGLSLRSNLDNVSYKLIKKGFMVSSGRDQKFYPMPSLAEIEKRNLRFWRSL